MNAKKNTKQYIARHPRNPHLIYCTDGEFHAEVLVCVGGWTAKAYTSVARAKRALSWIPVIVEEI